MAKYVIYAPCSLNVGKTHDGKVISAYFYAGPEGRTIELPNDVEPSRKWDPLDKAAQAALLKLGVKRDIVRQPEEPKPVEPEVDTMSGMQRRTVDRSPV